MVIGERLRQLREKKGMSQGEVESKTRLLRCYISRCENGHTVPALETLEKFAHAYGVPLYMLFVDGEEPKGARAISAGRRSKVNRTARMIEHLNFRDQKLVTFFVGHLARRSAA